MPLQLELCILPWRYLTAGPAPHMATQAQGGAAAAPGCAFCRENTSPLPLPHTWCRRGEVVPLQPECDALERLLGQVDPEGDLEAFWQVAASAAATGGALSARQAETLDQISRELMASPHIVRWGA